MKISPLAGKPAPPGILVDVPRLIGAYYSGVPSAAVPAQRVAFGTSGHRGSSFDLSFDEAHVLAITEAICRHRTEPGINGPLFLGIDTHALSAPACATALEVLAARGVEVMIAAGDDYTPTPAISHAILNHNRGPRSRLADGIVITPSYNPPRDGGFKYNPPNGGPAGKTVTDWIEKKANALLAAGTAGVRRTPHPRALTAPTTHRHDYLTAYVDDLGAVVDLEIIRGAKLRLGVDPLTQEFGPPFYDRVEAPATPAQQAALAALSLDPIELTELAGEKIERMHPHAPGNQAPPGGVKVQTASGWFAARSSGTEDIYRIYAESFHDEAHLRTILQEAQAAVNAALAGGTTDPPETGNGILARREFYHEPNQARQ